jgi:AP-3 complex subunit beta
LIGELQHLLQKQCPDILRILATTFVDEKVETRIQIVNLSVKLALNYNNSTTNTEEEAADGENILLLTTYILEMARYDTDTDLRDRARFLTALMGLAPSNEEKNSNSNVDEEALFELNDHAKNIMLAKKKNPIVCSNSNGSENFNFCSLSAMVGHRVDGFLYKISFLCGL